MIKSQKSRNAAKKQLCRWIFLLKALVVSAAIEPF